mmetsp:Transcript_1754/g.3849  ORF Transcript_1754/g.3849 Transcript_1754/m.3849 type:complete len:221 (-) Transcript_1754:1005-1667(-)
MPNCFLHSVARTTTSPVAIMGHHVNAITTSCMPNIAVGHLQLNFFMTESLEPSHSGVDATVLDMEGRCRHINKLCTNIEAENRNAGGLPERSGDVARIGNWINNHRAETIFSIATLQMLPKNLISLDGIQCHNGFIAAWLQIEHMTTIVWSKSWLSFFPDDAKTFAVAIIANFGSLASDNDANMNFEGGIDFLTAFKVLQTHTLNKFWQLHVGASKHQQA